MDKSGTPYHEKLKRLRERSGKPTEDIAWALGMTFIDYEEIENYPGEITRVVSLATIGKLASVLGVSAHDILDGPSREKDRISPEQLIAKIKAHLVATGSDIDSFENRVGFAIGDSLAAPSTIADWNLDCLRFVCAEIGVDWRAALP